MKTILVIAATFAAHAQTKVPPVLQQPWLYNVPFKAGEGYARYRIPALFVTAKRTPLACCEGRHKAGQLTGDIDLVLRRSLDNGQTWEPQQIIADIARTLVAIPALCRTPARARCGSASPRAVAKTMRRTSSPARSRARSWGARGWGN